MSTVAGIQAPCGVSQTARPFLAHRWCPRGLDAVPGGFPSCKGEAVGRAILFMSAFNKHLVNTAFTQTLGTQK